MKSKLEQVFTKLQDIRRNVKKDDEEGKTLNSNNT